MVDVMANQPSRQSEADLQELARRIEILKRQQAARLVLTKPRKLLPDGTVKFAARAGSDFIAAIFVALTVGPALDGLLGTWPWATFVFMVFSVAAGVLLTYRMAKSMASETADMQDVDAGDKSVTAARFKNVLSKVKT